MKALFLACIAFITLPTSASHPSVKTCAKSTVSAKRPSSIVVFHRHPVRLSAVLAACQARCRHQLWLPSDFLLNCVSSLQGPMTLSFLMGDVALTSVNVHGSLQSYLDGIPPPGPQWPSGFPSPSCCDSCCVCCTRIVLTLDLHPHFDGVRHPGHSWEKAQGKQYCLRSCVSENDFFPSSCCLRGWLEIYF